MRTTYSGLVDEKLIGQTVTLYGWAHRRRDHGGVIFIDLRDREGLVQVVCDPDRPDVFATADKVRNEFCLAVVGVVRARPEGTKNEHLISGGVEVLCQKLEILNPSLPPPFQLDDDTVSESARLTYRVLDLRRQQMQRNLKLRFKVAQAFRHFLDENGFIDIETPFLTKSTPEGARDYLVPSRTMDGHFFALPQSPQLFKQLLMIAGFDRYYQIVKCFRDEDLRADRQPEFTQIDLEMSFVDQDDVIAMQEGFLAKVFRELKGVEIQLPLPRITWDEAMERYGSDKPDTRFGFELKKLNDVVKDCGFKVFTDCMANGGDVRGICVTGGSEQFSRKDIDKLTDMTKAYGAKGLVWIRVHEGEYKSSVDKFFSQEELAEIAKVFDAKTDDLIFICSDRAKVTYDSLGFLRRECAKRMGLLDDNQYNLLWVVDFPMFEEDEEDHSLKAMHHPFTCPKLDQLELLDTDPLAVKADAYDIVLNGVELGGGSVRIHDKNLQAKMFEVLGLTKEDCDEKFGFLIEAFKYGAPPHAGLAYGLDRFVMLLLGEPSIREVIAFPKNQNAQCLVSSAPSPVDPTQLDELGITTKE